MHIYTFPSIPFNARIVSARVRQALERNDGYEPRRPILRHFRYQLANGATIETIHYAQEDITQVVDVERLSPTSDDLMLYIAPSATIIKD